MCRNDCAKDTACQEDASDQKNITSDRADSKLTITTSKYRGTTAKVRWSSKFLQLPAYELLLFGRDQRPIGKSGNSVEVAAIFSGPAGPFNVSPWGRRVCQIRLKHHIAPVITNSSSVDVNRQEAQRLPLGATVQTFGGRSICHNCTFLRKANRSAVDGRVVLLYGIIQYVFHGGMMLSVVLWSRQRPSTTWHFLTDDGITRDEQHEPKSPRLFRGTSEHSRHDHGGLNAMMASKAVESQIFIELGTDQTRQCEECVDLIVSASLRQKRPSLYFEGPLSSSALQLFWTNGHQCTSTTTGRGAESDSSCAFNFEVNLVSPHVSQDECMKGNVLTETSFLLLGGPPTPASHSSDRRAAGRGLHPSGIIDNHCIEYLTGETPTIAQVPRRRITSASHHGRQCVAAKTLVSTGPQVPYGPWMWRRNSEPRSEVVFGIKEPISKGNKQAPIRLNRCLPRLPKPSMSFMRAHRATKAFATGFSIVP
ncbi:hypothetical protein NLU13_2816 [Sarocladium strictum]|uniref:Uncharacterized protein n=1 Tax=Sarocladium strictum TaxID=5046 RepID=A0AA39GL63_SARSR|nr:hypothetical protein NLU13_2816 [Sarocladium strictum]